MNKIDIFLLAYTVLAPLISGYFMTPIARSLVKDVLYIITKREIRVSFYIAYSLGVLQAHIVFWLVEYMARRLGI
jgi:hypothetical protein